MLATQTTGVKTLGHKVIYDGNGSTSGSVPVDNNNYLQGANVTVLPNYGSLVINRLHLCGLEYPGRWLRHYLRPQSDLCYG